MTGTPLRLYHTLDDDIKQGKKEEVGAQDEVNKWLENVHSKSSSSLNPLAHDPKQEKQRKLKTIPIPEVHKKLHLVLHSLAAVQGAMQQLQEKLVTSDANEWQEAIAKTTQLKADYLNAKEQLNMSQMSELKLKLDARRKKRMRQKKRKEEVKEDEQQELYERAQKHLAIDQWRHQIQQKI
ncbi:hypothetical protein C0Q70_20409 [Pomacea canaliculata]|uniref:Uncharacterized protein n=1 Tax=Pomacea canaliculata TaxID=400727 RepID=A0A2T7NFJ0_POMCA|nr:hypothetical protein C0Q70_20409 [Pomacea canaliculata]